MKREELAKEISDKLKLLLDLHGVKVFDNPKNINVLIDLIEENYDAQTILKVFDDVPVHKDMYFHFIYCNGGYNYPIGAEGKICNCQNTPLLKRLRETWRKKDGKKETI